MSRCTHQKLRKVEKLKRQLSLDDQDLIALSITNPYICMNCHITIFNNSTSTVKPRRYTLKYEVNPFELLQKAKKQVTGFKSLLSLEYIPNRWQMVDHVDRLAKKYKASVRTTIASVFYVDLLMRNYEDLNFDLTVISSFLLSMKLSERHPRIPSYCTFRSTSNIRLFTKNEIKRYELNCIRLLDYKLCYITAYDVLETLLVLGVVLEDEKHRLRDVESVYSECIATLRRLIYADFYFDYDPITVSSSVVCIAREANNLENRWNEYFACLYDIDFEDFEGFYELARKFLSEQTKVEKYKETRLVSSMLCIHPNQHSQYASVQPSDLPIGHAMQSKLVEDNVNIGPNVGLLMEESSLAKKAIKRNASKVENRKSGRYSHVFSNCKSGFLRDLNLIGKNHKQSRNIDKSSLLNEPNELKIKLKFISKTAVSSSHTNTFLSAKKHFKTKIPGSFVFNTVDKASKSRLDRLSLRNKLLGNIPNQSSKVKSTRSIKRIDQDKLIPKTNSTAYESKQSTAKKETIKVAKPDTTQRKANPIDKPVKGRLNITLKPQAAKQNIASKPSQGSISKIFKPGLRALKPTTVSNKPLVFKKALLSFLPQAPQAK